MGLEEKPVSVCRTYDVSFAVLQLLRGVLSATRVGGATGIATLVLRHQLAVSIC